MSKGAPTYVSLVGKDFIRVDSAEDKHHKSLEDIGFRREFLSTREFTITAEDDDIVASIFRQLQRLDVAFLDEPAGWPPAAVFEHMIERQLLNYPFRAITWTSPNDWHVSVKTMLKT